MIRMIFATRDERTGAEIKGVPLTVMTGVSGEPLKKGNSPLDVSNLTPGSWKVHCDASSGGFVADPPTIEFDAKPGPTDPNKPPVFWIPLHPWKLTINHLSVQRVGQRISVSGMGKPNAGLSFGGNWGVENQNTAARDDGSWAGELPAVEAPGQYTITAYTENETATATFVARNM
jgi:hypothetical protein